MDRKYYADVDEEMLIKTIVQRSSKWFAGLVIISIALTAGLMFYQYTYLRNQSDKLLELQEEYRGYLLRLRAIVDDLQKGSEQDQSETMTGEKKKSFMTVNRKPEYLSESLVQYLKENKLEREFKELSKRNYIPKAAAKKSRRRSKNRKSMPRKVTSQDLGLMSDIAQQIHKEITFAWPLDISLFRISSPFGPRKKANGAPDFHYGVDLAAYRGTMVKAAAAGEVIEANYSQRGYGNTVVIMHSKKYKTRYAHLDAIHVRVGQRVKELEHIGTVGSTGHVRGKYPWHLHFEVYVGQDRINPLWVLPKIK